jgi:hypothetical protein
MITHLFNIFRNIDTFLRSFLPLWGSLVLWGLLGGGAVMGLYALLSPQRRIRAKKQEIKELKAEMKDDSLGFAGTLRLTRQNLRRAFELLGLVLPPSLVAMLPALCMMLFVSILYSYQVPEAGQDLKVKTTPYSLKVRVQSGGVVVNTGKSGFVVIMDKKPRIRIYESKRIIYSWTPDMLMDGSVRKRPWWGGLLPEGAGYLPEDSVTEKISIGFRTLRVIGGVPRAIGGWEFSYFLALTISAVLVKVKFRIE